MAEVATSATSDQLLVVIDPVARRTDGESVRIAKDVLGAGAQTKLCLPDGPEEFARALARRGSRRPVVIGDDRALVRAVALLHRRRELAACALSLVPVGGALDLARSLGVPTGAVAAARAVLEGVERRMDLLVDDSDGVVLGAVRIPPLGAAPAPEAEPGRPWLRTCQSLVRTLVPSRPSRIASAPETGPARLRVEVDGKTLVDLHQSVRTVSVVPGASGTARVEVRPASVGAEASPLAAEGRTVTVSGAHFRYRADALVSGPVRTRTWEVREEAWGIVLPAR
ncbi:MULTISPECIES: diacylglycerol kinase family protein [Streptomyces]|uniref:Diacylglycerol kinase n=1 Tax=Streptomyces viridosporus T7A TaxID=665577 RepID=A0ABX6AGC4_STRVD|nr:MULTISPECIES: diacylglycerol kinase family protein [Streptomyces]PWJ07815.1 diacylglycerol kinase [Streptomyces sp. NWU49]QEU86890.1 diacylglycerol kinase [Streptomyces viridosporus T7A]